MQPRPRGRLPNLPLGQTIRCLSFALVIALWSPPAASPPGSGEGGKKPVLAFSWGLGTPVSPRERPPGAPCPSPGNRIPGRDAPAAKRPLMPNPSRSRVPTPAHRGFASPGRAQGGLGDEQPLGKQKVGLGVIPPGAPRTSGQFPDPLSDPASPPPRGSSPQSRERHPSAGSGGPGTCSVKGGRGLRGRGHPAWPLMGRAPPRRAAGGLTWGERRLWGGGGSRAGRRGPAGRRAVKEASRAPGAGAALCVPKLRDPPLPSPPRRPRSP